MDDEEEDYISCGTPLPELEDGNVIQNAFLNYTNL